MDSCLGLALFLVILVPFLLFTLFFNILGLSFQHFGLSAGAALLLASGSLLGSVVNVPVYRRPARSLSQSRGWHSWLYYRPPVVDQRIIAVNAGGAVMTGLAIYECARASLGAVVIVFTLVAALCKLASHTRQDNGVVVPAFIPALSAGVLAFFLAHQETAAVAYAGGVFGTLVGTDLLNLGTVFDQPDGILAIGGAGVFESLFLVGIVALLLT